MLERYLYAKQLMFFLEGSQSDVKQQQKWPEFFICTSDLIVLRTPLMWQFLSMHRRCNFLMPSTPRMQ